jgi:NitT/TauT family transport system substrate-binding protein
MRPDPDGIKLLNRKLRPGHRVLLAATAGGAVLLAAAGCSAGSGMTQVSETITIAAVPGIDDAPLYLANAKGYFAADGLHVKIDNVSSESQVLAALNGSGGNQAEIGDADYGTIFTAEASQGDLRLLADGFDAGSGSVQIMSLPKDNITSPLGLQKSAIGLPKDSTLSSAGNLPGVPDSLYAAAARDVMSDYLASGASTLSWTLLSQPQELHELADGQLKAALLTEPYIYEAETLYGASPVLDAFSSGTAGMPISGYVSTNSWVKANPGAVADFQAALDEAQAQASMTGSIQQVLPKLPGSLFTTDSADLATVGTYPTSTNVTELQRVTQMMLTESMITRNTAVGLRQMLVNAGT